MPHRTRERRRREVSLLLHLIDGHRSRLPEGVSHREIFERGMAAMQTLGLDAVCAAERWQAGRAARGWTPMRDFRRGAA